MLESLQFDWHREEPSSVKNTASTRGKARQIPALRPADEFWPWPLKRADFALPVWKQQRLFRLNREYEERLMVYLHEIAYNHQAEWKHRQLILDHLKISHV
jgi:hypothetical protein